MKKPKPTKRQLSYIRQAVLRDAVAKGTLMPLDKAARLLRVPMAWIIRRKTLLTELQQVFDQIKDLTLNPPPDQEQLLSRLAELRQWQDRVITDLMNLSDS
jgi:hypothetical protein